MKSNARQVKSCACDCRERFHNQLRLGRKSVESRDRPIIRALERLRNALQRHKSVLLGLSGTLVVWDTLICAIRAVSQPKRQPSFKRVERPFLD